MSIYKHTGPVPCDVDFDASAVKGKTTIVTGGANGIGEAYVRALVNAGRKEEIKYNESGTTKLDLETVEVNLHGVLCTTKFATHYFIAQNGKYPSEQQEDTCLVLIGSGAAFLDVLRRPQYPATTWAVRGMMHTLRRTSDYDGSRVDVISPCYVKTRIFSEKAFEQVRSKGVEFATAQDAGWCLLRIFSDKSVNGHSFFLSARKWASRGYMDLNLEEYDDELLREMQRDQIANSPPEDGLMI